MGIRLFFAIFVFADSVIGFGNANLEGEVEFQCIQHCPLQNRTNASRYDYACDYGCNVNQCNKGCKLWKDALNTSCQNACIFPRERMTPRDLHCVMGCQDAMAKYFAQLKSKLLIPPATALVADSLGATSLKLAWNFPEAKRVGLSYHVEWHFEEVGARWNYCKNVTWSPDDAVVLVQNLEPYTKYRFRIVLVFVGNQANKIESAPSVVISTKASGVPVSSPRSVRVTPIDHSQISVNWEPGQFPHGPLLSYVLQITDSELHSAEVKDIPAEATYYTFKNLLPNHNYDVSIRMTNGVGSGPAAHVAVSTPPEPRAKDTQEPILILGTDNGVIEQGRDIADEPVILYSTLRRIRGIAIHIRKKLLFVSESGSVLKMPLSEFTKQENITVILAPPQIDFTPLDLSVDWLNDQVYILGEVRTQQKNNYQITRCDFDGRGLTVAYSGFGTKPHNFEVDPFNGYLFWTVRSGLYRLDISHVSNGIKREVQPELILADPNLGAFTIDHANFTLLVSQQKQNTVNTVSLDGKEVINIRPNIIKSKLSRVISLAMANHRFYWTDGEGVFYEEYLNSDYFHNSYPGLQTRVYQKVLINLETSQPIPTPLNPPTNVQGIFGKNLVKVSWQAPELLGIQGKGAWENWSYRIEFKKRSSKRFNKLQNDINSTFYEIQGLDEDTEYVIRAAAYTESGPGPCSSEFNGITLGASNEPLIYWSGSRGLLTTDATAGDLQTLIYKNYYFVDMTWFKDLVYLVTNDSSVYWYDKSSRRHGQITDIDSVGGIAVDWIGEKLYWSNPKKQMITRGNLNGTQQEPLPIVTSAKELKIDSVKAFLYWSTGYAVTCAHPNGEDLIEYQLTQVFAGKQVMGLTLDVDSKRVYWILRGADGSTLYSAPMAGYSEDPLQMPTVYTLQKPNMQGPLCYFHKRLLWLQDDKNTAISDLTGKYVATISGDSMSNLTLAYAVDPILYEIPETESGSIMVIPEIVDNKTIRVTGSPKSFNVTWNPVKNVNYGEVFYEIHIDGSSRNDSTIVTTHHSIKYWQKVPPFIKLNVSIRAFTYWGSSSQVRAEIRSPSSLPSAPRNLRAFVTKYHNTQPHSFTITLRWDPPRFPNGFIEGYEVCHIKQGVCSHPIINGAKDFQREIVKLNPTVESHLFTVRAFNEIGRGEASHQILVNSSRESPLPLLLIASRDSVSVQDMDSNQNESLLYGINTPTEVGYSIGESKVFWINQLHDLMMYDIVSSNKTKIADLSRGAKSLSYDWLERSLYYVQNNDFNNNGSTVYKIDLNYLDWGTLKSDEVLTTPQKINKIHVSPYSQRLYWLENHKVMTSDTNGHDLRLFVNKAESCNCSDSLKIEQLTLDHSVSSSLKPNVIFMDSDHNIISSDRNGCNCSIISFLVSNNSDKIERFEADSNNIYWTTEGQLFSIVNHSQFSHNIEHVLDIKIWGPHMQPYPSAKCLGPDQNTNDSAVKLKYKTFDSLTLIMPKYGKLTTGCDNSSMATVKYMIYYAQEDNNLEAFFTGCANCSVAQTFETVYTIYGLKPFTNYLVAVAVRNFYTDREDVVMGRVEVFQTAVGAPSKPQNVTVKVLNPNLVKVAWCPPQEFNGATVHYEIYWQTEGTLSGVRQSEQPVVEQKLSPNSTKKYFTTYLSKMSPNETYTIWVKAYSSTNETSSDSDRVQINTYPEPADLILINKKAYTLTLFWNNTSTYIEKHRIEYCPLSSNDWKPVSHNPKNKSEIVAKDLTPKTHYKFRLTLRYVDYPEDYIWPFDTRFVFETLGDRPSRPGIPIIQYVRPKMYKLWWEASRDNGARIELYMLEGLKLPNYRRDKRSTIEHSDLNANRSAFYYNSPAVEEETREWMTFYNGTDTSWIIDGLSEKYKYEFRVSALNLYGWSEPSESSTAFDLNEAARMAEQQNPTTMILVATLIPLSVLLFLVVLCLLCLKFHKKPKKVLGVARPLGPDVELATLRELPRRGVHNTNVLYVATQPTTEELTLLPHIRRDQITLMKFLGSGAFGEVFEGKARGITGSGNETKVAVKTLRKGASDQEKTEFMQEAQLMSNFKHEHILQLLGVCLDNDPHFIIMELMQGGDLLTYLRNSRNITSDTPSLTLNELLKMCVDVSKGCRYLEEMHFVHRDLAGRNCLVSSKEPDNRIVKIGDFGLARDIYKNDYYRNEGGGLLPVRWMAPESLVDGVYTTQSDVWAFGVLLWEIMTLGQQPYPARNNLEVLHYVRRGGRLGKPTDCPEALHNLMLKCWEFQGDSRPTFRYCLDVLIDLHLQNMRRSTTGAHEGQYISTVQEYFEGISNQAYFLDEKNELSVETEDETTNKEVTPFLQHSAKETSIPKYLELLYEPHSPPVPNDGYEIPNQMLPKSEEPSLTNGSSISTNTSDKQVVIKESNGLKEVAVNSMNGTRLPTTNNS